MGESPENWLKFGKWMLERRQLLGLSQEKAADLAGIHRQQWYRIENGASTKRSTVISIASALEEKPEVALAIAYGLEHTSGHFDISDEMHQISIEMAELTKLFIPLPPDQRKNVLAIVESLYKMHAKGREIGIVDDVDISESDAREIKSGKDS